MFVCPELILTGSDAADPAALVALVNALPDDALVHTQVWDTLNHLLDPYHCDSDRLLDVAVAAGLIETACTSLVRHATDADVAFQACGMLHRVTQHPTHHHLERMGAAGVATTLATVLSTLPQSQCIVHRAVATLFALTSLPANRLRVVAADGRTVVTRALADHPLHIGIQLTGQRLVERLPVVEPCIIDSPSVPVV